MSSSLHRVGDGSLADLEWITRRWNTSQAYAWSKCRSLHWQRQWPGNLSDVISNAVDPGWVRTRMGGAAAPVDVESGQRTQTWLAASNDSPALVSGRYWHNMRQEDAASEMTDQDIRKPF